MLKRDTVFYISFLFFSEIEVLTKKTCTRCSLGKPVDILNTLLFTEMKKSVRLKHLI